MDRQSKDPDDRDERLPRRVLARLEARDRPAVPAAPEVDAAILAEARAYFAARGADEGVVAASELVAAAGEGGEAGRGERDGAGGHVGESTRRRRPETPSRSALRRVRGVRRRRARWAAAVAAAAVAFAALLVVRPIERFSPYDPDDIDRSGRVDILDAFALARMRADGAPIDAADIDAVAARVVALEPRGIAR